MKAVILTALAVVISGCAAQPEEPPTASALMSAPDREEPQVVCKREKPTGSNRRIKVCRQVGDAIDDEQTRRDMQTLQRQSELINPPPD